MCNTSVHVLLNHTLLYNFARVHKDVHDVKDRCMDIEDIINDGRPNNEIVESLRVKNPDIPDWSDILNEYEPNRHAVMDKRQRPDKVRRGRPIEKVSRIPVSLERLTVNRISQFMFALPVKRIYSNADTGNMPDIQKAIEQIYRKVRINSVNIARSKNYFASCEMCTIWFPVDSPNTYYGFNSAKKLKCKVCSPMDGYRLYPFFDEYGDMIAMSIEYTVKTYEGDEVYFETYTDSKHYTWVNGAGRGEWEQTVEDNPIGKIPCIYMNRMRPIWDIANGIRDEIEKTMSRHGDILAYNSAPALKAVGNLINRPARDDARRLYEVEKGGDLSYIQWNQSVDATKFNVDTLLRLWFMLTQMPDISFDNIKAIASGTSGEALKTVLTDSYLKIHEESGPFLEFFDRELNVVKEFLKRLQPSWAKDIDNMEVEQKIVPFTVSDEGTAIANLQKANGGKALMSHLESIQAFGKSADPTKTLDEINKEVERDNEARSIYRESAL